MSRDHNKLRVFNDAHQMAVAIYRHTKDFPKEEQFGMRVQLRRAAVSVPSNIVEGCARKSTREYCNFINIGLGSASELGYLSGLATELGFIGPEAGKTLGVRSTNVIKQLQRLGDELELLAASERGK
jgi:four helix bundle protein